jgi:Kef-type K+ transport system membrane component KefB
MLIGPYALGDAHSGVRPTVFTDVRCFHARRFEIYAVATMASVLWLFHAGRETDLGVVLRYSTAGTADGIGRARVAFALGPALQVGRPSLQVGLSPPALLLGAVATAIPVGITARILSASNKTPRPKR